MPYGSLGKKAQNNASIVQRRLQMAGNMNEIVFKILRGRGSGYFANVAKNHSSPHIKMPEFLRSVSRELGTDR